MAGALVMFRESNFSPWGNRQRSTRRSSLPDATEKYSSSVGSISAVNKLLSEEGLQYPSNSLLLPALVGQPSSSARETDAALLGDNKIMAQKRKKTRKHSGLFSSGDGLPPPSEESKLVELASFPGYDPHRPTPLPHGLDTMHQMQITLRAQTMLSWKREGFRETWKTLFYSAPSQAIFQDYFWWFFLHKYQNSKLLSVQSQLFNRISANYVNLLSKEVDLRWRDPFFKVYPDVVAQCVYSAFVHAYPASWSSFDGSFRSSLVTIMSLWQVGTRPLYTVWKKWNFDVLEPTNHLKHLSSEKSDQEIPSKSPKKNAFELDALLKKCDEEQKKILPKYDKESPEDKTLLCHISPGNFDSFLATSKASNNLYISPSKEELIRFQVDLTRTSGNTDSTSTAGSTESTRISSTESTRVHWPCPKKSPVKNPTVPSCKPKATKAPSPSQVQYVPATVSEHHIDIPLFLNEGEDIEGKQFEVYLTPDDLEQEQLDELARYAKPNTKQLVVKTRKKIDNFDIVLTPSRPPPVKQELPTGKAGPSATGKTVPKTRFSPTTSVNPQQSASSSRISPHKMSSSVIKSTASSGPNISSTMSNKSPTNDPVFKKPAGPLPHRRKLQAQKTEQPPPLPPKKSKSHLQNISCLRSQVNEAHASPKPSAPIESKSGATATAKETKVLWKQRAFASIQGHIQEAQTDQKPQPTAPVENRPVPERTPVATNLQSGMKQLQLSPKSVPPEREATATAAVQEKKLTEWKEKAKAILKREREAEAQAPVPIAPCSFEHVQFDLFGHSPLVNHFLQERQLSRENESKVLTGRTELVDESETTSISYQDVLCEAFEKAVEVYERTEKVYQEAKREMVKASKARNKASKKSEQELKMVLSAKNEVKQLSNVLTTYILKEHDSTQRREHIASAIESIVTQLNKVPF